jgi:5-methylcytosine-specific restriction endonuclease McrA
MIRRRAPLSRRSRVGKKTSKRRKSRLALRRECDRRFAVAIKDRDGWECRACGGTDRIQCAHVISRRYHATRWSLANAVALCAGCHMKYTHDPLGWEAWVEDRWGSAIYGELKRLARQGVAHIDYEAILETLPKGER